MTTKRFTSALTVLATLATMGLANMATVSAAHATDTRNAINMCINRGSAECVYYGTPTTGYDIIVTDDDGDHAVHCPPEATGQCSVDHGGSGGHPTREIISQDPYAGPMNTTVLGEPKVSTAPTAGPVRTVRMGRGLQ